MLGERQVVVHRRSRDRLSPSGLEGGVLSSPTNLRSWVPTRWLSVGAITSVAALSLSIGSAGAFAAPPAARSRRAPAAGRLFVRPAPHTVTHSRRSPRSALTAPACNDQWNVVTAANAGTNANNELNAVS